MRSSFYTDGNQDIPSVAGTYAQVLQQASHEPQDEQHDEEGARHFRAIFISDLHLGTPGCQAEALLEFLKTSKIPVVNISIGPVHKKDVMKAMKALAADESKQKKEFATLLAFDVRITPEAAKFAEEEGIKIFSANIIYHLFDEFTKYVKEC